MMKENPVIQWHDISSRRSSEDILNIFTQMLERSFPNMIGHSQRVVKVCLQIGEALRLSQDELYSLSLAAKFHDIGLVGIPVELLLKKDAWTQDEEIIIAQHANQGGRLVAKAFPDFPDAAEGIWFHHERVDGKGPLGLKDDEIPIIAKIISLVTTIEEMVNGTPHKPAIALPDIIEKIKAGINYKFDLKVTTVFFELSTNFYDILIGDDLKKAILKRSSPVQAGFTPASPVPGTIPVSAPKVVASPTLTPMSIPARIPAPASLPKRASQNVPLVNNPSHDLSPIITRGEVVQLIRKGLELKPFSVNAHNIMAVTQSPRCSAEDVAREVGLDQALSLRVLKLSNSSMFTTGRPTNSIKAAVARIGVREVRNLVMALNVVQYYEGQISQYLDPQLFWEHSIGCGLIASALGKACRSKSTDEFFLSGIVHDVGRLVLVDHIPEKYAQVWEAAEKHDLPLNVAEQKLLTIDHTSILEQALSHWNFPREFVTPVANHHKAITKIKTLPREQVEPTALLALASQMTHALIIGQSGNEVIYPLDDWVDMLGIKEEVLTRIERSIPDEAAALKLSLIARSNSDMSESAVAIFKKKLDVQPIPLCVSSRPWSDAFRMFFERLSDGIQDDLPNIGIIYLRETREQKTLIPRFEEMEKKYPDVTLPIILICEKSSEGLDQQWLNARPHAVFTRSVRISTLLKTLEQILPQTQTVAG